MMRHAFLILAHDNEAVLSELLQALDEPRCDTFLHVDSKSGMDCAALSRRYPRVNLIDRRIDARWGDFSLVEVELELLRAALAEGPYEYLHLISGVDYPPHGVDYIIDFCSANMGKEFVGFAADDAATLRWRAGRRFLFARDFKSRSFLKKGIRAAHARLQSLPGLRHRIDAEVRRGSQWCSITSEFARYVVAHESWLRKNFSRTYCPDEMAIQTLCWNSRFRDSIFDSSDEFHGCMRYIPWHDGELRGFCGEDFKRMRETGVFFARKFTLPDIIRLKNEKG